MFKSYYKLKIVGKDLKRFIKTLYKLNIYIEEIELDNHIGYIKIDKKNYEKIKKVKTSYTIDVVNLYGIEKIFAIFKKNSFFVLSSILGIFFLYLLSSLILDIEVVHNDKEIRTLILNELETYGVKKYSFVKSYNYMQQVKNKIINNNKEKIEWMEIERIGTKYNIRVEKRIINNTVENPKNSHIVAKKTGIITRISAEEGEIVKKVNDYVKEGDIIISGIVYKNDKIVNNVSAKGNVYAEVWYKAKIELPLNYKEETLTKNKQNLINIQFLTHNFNILDFYKYKHKKVETTILFKDFFNMFNIKYNKETEVEVKDEINDIIGETFAINIARKKIEENLKQGEYIISQKKLKTIVNNSTITIEIFFKVCENISKIEYYSTEEG